MRTSRKQAVATMTRLAALLVGTALLLAACQGTAAAPASIPADAPRVVADRLDFVTQTLEVPAGRAFVLVLENREGVPHNVHVKDPSGGSVSQGEVFSGPGERAQDVPALSAATYPFICDLHPDMQGHIVAIEEG